MHPARVDASAPARKSASPRRVRRADSRSVPAGSTSSGSTGASTAFKDRIDAALVARLGAAFAAVEPSFPVDRFRRSSVRGLGALELKARIAHVAAALAASLPDDFPTAATTVGGVLDRVDAGEIELDGWELWPVTDWVAACGRGHPDVALELLARLTRYATGEFAVRPFIDDDRDGVLARLDRWVDSGDEHVRRLISEGTRPRLPWAPRLAVAAADPGYALPLLERLVDDASEYVRRSVSNHLNDLCRCDVELGLAVASSWAQRAAASVEPVRSRIEWVVARGLRSLVKAGNPDALRLVGHDPDAAVEAVELVVHTPVVQLGDEVVWSLTLVSADDRPHHVVVDYAIHFLRPDGSTGRKVFKWTTFDLAAGERRRLERRHRITPVTIRTYRPGVHVFDVQVNGRLVATGRFDLEV